MKVFAISLGCPKNTIDTELALGSLSSTNSGLKLTNNPQEADLLIVNTCGFIEEAVSESIDTILTVAKEKTNRQVLVVMGCMVQRYGDDLKKELPEVDIFLGTGSPQSLARLIEDQTIQHQVQSPDPRILITPPWRAYVKISEGCSNRCTYCLIPMLRGKETSRPIAEIVSDVNSLATKGVKEITMVAQDLTAYRNGENTLPDLLKALAGETGLPWLRLLYLHPGKVNIRLLETIAANTAICPYLDIPIQHACTNILRSMGRKYDSKALEDLMSRISNLLPHASVRTTVMVGFPGETEDDFQKLRSFVEKWEFDHLGCFVYSDEKECVANKLPGKVSSDLAVARKDEIMNIQARISRGKNSDMVGKVEQVLVEGVSSETELLLVGRTRYQAPEIDGIVYLNEGSADCGEIVSVKITDSHIYDLVGKII
ncbi:MAG: 30S ribosomal protein S12 methylthiotransferase RimO [Deltaproteobacteria bacterium]|nr:30S ribosomal protein S12 methylthiotransferase RimO [Deltaproteobacteria bacterium]MBW1937218.1 30S ribosomal protein S12 methylthiotransferase RimO [Deltaproteobacteria bacterium]MBW1963833.1 30S ribosomal protein S12 methylthiotransferase RimO [Deltaproteobacteria bacterium]